MSARVWDIILTCPRPKPRVSVGQQEWHLASERIQRTVDTFFPRGSRLSLTSRTVRLYTYASSLAVLPGVEAHLATALDCMYFDASSDKSLPAPIRFEISERSEQIPPTEEAGMT